MASNLIEVTDQNFQTSVLSSDVPVLVDFWAPWCAPCHAIAPHVESIQTEMGDKIKVVKLNVDDQPETARTYGIRSIPTLILFKNGAPADHIIGSVSKSSLVEFVSKNLG